MSPAPMSPAKTSLIVSRYDRINAWLVSTILVFGFVVCILFCIWYSVEFTQSRNFGFEPDQPVKNLMLTDVSLDKDELDLTDFKPAAAPLTKNDIEAIPDIISTLKANSAVKSEYESLLNSTGTRELGPVGPDGNGEGVPGKTGDQPPHKRWSVIYESPNKSAYIDMLKQFEIEIGIVHLKENQILRVQHAEGNKFKLAPSNRTAEAKSFYFLNDKPSMRRWDLNIAKQLGAELDDTAMVHFYPPQTLKKMHTAELGKATADGKKIEDIVKTRFKMVDSKITVAEIKYQSQN